MTLSSSSLDAVAPGWREMAARSALCAVASMLGWYFQDRAGSVAIGFFVTAYFFGGWDLAVAAWADFRKFRFSTHFLMLLVPPAAALVGAWGEGSLLLVLFSASAALEEYAMGRTRSAIDVLLRGPQKPPSSSRTRGKSRFQLKRSEPAITSECFQHKEFPSMPES